MKKLMKKGKSKVVCEEEGVGASQVSTMKNDFFCFRGGGCFCFVKGYFVIWLKFHLDK